MTAIPPKRAHVNMMTDTVIANLPPETLRAVMRSILTLYPSFTEPFETQARKLLEASTPDANPTYFLLGVPTNTARSVQAKIRSMLGCGLVYKSLPFIETIIQQTAENLTFSPSPPSTVDFLASVDGDIVQATTAIQKKSATTSASHALDGKAAIQRLLECMSRAKSAFVSADLEFPFERGSDALQDLQPSERHEYNRTVCVDKFPIGAFTNIETFELNHRHLPRLFCGLWQLSSPAWGSAPQSKVVQQFANYVRQGFVAFDMADHYGDAEVLFGRFRQSCANPDAIFGATKYCIFDPIKVTPRVIEANISERCSRLSSDKIDLLQFHWQDYSDSQYMEALKLLEQDDRVSLLGLCNFDTLNMKRVLENGINIATNQVQFSLIDSRPTLGMDKVCEQYGVKLLTYGTLCGGWLADKWLGQDEPELFLNDITPSQRKYFEMILSWGDWTLFQELLQTLSDVASRYKVSVANVATRWVLDFPYVGAVLVGSRMGVSERADENLASYGWHLDETDRAAIDIVLTKSNRAGMYQVMGDCGGEYR